MRSEVGFLNVLKAALLAGLLAGLLVATFHFVATEPIIDRAITIEEAMSQDAAEEPVVSREVQRGGLFIGYVIYGLSWSLLFAAAFYLAQRRLPASTIARRGLLLAVAAYWSVALLPFLKYPANPPGVGDSETIAYRQGLYLALLVLGIASTAAAFAVGRWVKRASRPAWAPWAAGLAAALVMGAILVAAMPANPDAVRMPTEVVSGFRVLSLAGLTLFWAILGGAFALLAARWGGRTAGRAA